MAIERVTDPEQVIPDAIAVATQAPWATMATVDSAGRPRSRVVHPVWWPEGGALAGVLTSRPTPVKRAHLARTPYASFAYRSEDHSVLYIDAAVLSVDDDARRTAAWHQIARVPEPLGFDPSTIFAGPDAEDFLVLDLRPYRIQVGLGADLARGRPTRMWLDHRTERTRSVTAPTR
jgi:hypothetical protein